MDLTVVSLGWGREEGKPVNIFVPSLDNLWVSAVVFHRTHDVAGL
jgi:hypothetical protein